MLLTALLSSCGGSGGGGAEQQPQVSSQKPTVSLPSDMTVAELVDGQASTVKITANVTNPRQQALSYDWQLVSGEGVDVAGFSGDSVEFVAPNVTSDTLIELSLTVKDTGGHTATDTIKITIAKVNNKPVIGPQSRIVVVEQSAFSIPATVTDEDNDELTYEWSLGDAEGLNVSLVENNTPVLKAQIGDIEKDIDVNLLLTVNDGDGGIVTQSYLVEMLNDDSAPTGVVLVGGTAISTNSVSLDWLEGDDDVNQSDEIRYRVHLSTESNFVPSVQTQQIEVTGTLSAELTQLNVGTQYYAIVEACDKSGNKAYSNQVAVSTLSKVNKLSDAQSVIPLETFVKLGNKFTYTLSEATPLPEIGDVLVNEEDDGFLLNVTSVKQSGTIAEVETEPSSLSKVYQELDLQTRVKLINVTEQASKTSRAKLSRKGVNALIDLESNETKMNWTSSHLTLSETNKARSSNSVTRSARASVENSAQQQSATDRNLTVSAPKEVLFRPEQQNEFSISASIIDDEQGTLEVSELELVEIRHADTVSNEYFGASLAETTFDGDKSHIAKTLYWTPVNAHVDFENNQPYLATFRATVNKANDVSDVVLVTVKIYVGYSLPDKTNVTLSANNEQIQLTADTEFSFEPEIEITADITSGNLTSARAKISAFSDFDVTMNLVAQTAGSVESQSTILDRSFTKLAVGGDAPIIVSGRFKLDAVISANATDVTDLKHHINAGLDLDAGFEYVDGVWHPIAEVQPSISYSLTGESEGSAYGDVKLVPSLELWFYDVASGQIVLEPYVFAQSDMQGIDNQDSSNEPAQLVQSVSSGLGADVKLQADLSALDSNVAAWPSEDNDDFTKVTPVAKTTMAGTPALSLALGLEQVQANSCLIDLSAEVTPVISPFGQQGTLINWVPDNDQWTISPLGQDEYVQATTNNGDLYNAQTLLKSFNTYSLVYSGNSELGSWAEQQTSMELDFSDANGDQLPDFWAERYGVTSASADDDNDGLTNLEEFEHCTLPKQADSDSDGMSDIAELNNGLDPHSNDALGDLDGDGRTNLLEISQNTPANIANLAPIVSIEVLEFNEVTSRLHLSANAIDSDGNIINFNWSETSEHGLVLTNNNTSEVEIQLPFVDVETVFKFNVAVTDNEGAVASADSDISVTVVERVNTPPSVVITTEGVIQQQTTIVLDGSESYDLEDGEDAVFTFQWQQTSGTNVELLNASQAITQFELPQNLQNESFEFVLTVTDSEMLPGTSSIIINGVDFVNSVPVADAGSDQNVAEGQQVVLDGSASADEEDGNNLTYSWQPSEDNEISITLADSETVSPEFVSPIVNEAIELSFVLTVTDTAGALDVDEVSVLVEPAPIDITAGLTAYYQFDNDLQDGSGNELHGASTSELSYLVGVRGQGVGFDGVDDFVTITNAEVISGESVSIAYWLKPENLSSEQTVLHQNSGFNSTINTNSIGTAFWSEADGDFVNYQVEGAVADYGEWLFYVVTYEHRTSSLNTYINGELVSTVNDVQNFPANVINADVIVGRNGSGGNVNLSGMLDETRFYDRAIKPAEVSLLYSQRQNFQGQTWLNRYGSNELHVDNTGVELYGRDERAGGFTCASDGFDFTEQQIQYRWHVSNNQLASYGFELLDATGDVDSPVVTYGGYSTDHAYNGSTLITSGQTYYTQVQVKSNHSVTVTTTTGDYSGDGSSLVKKETINFLRDDVTLSDLKFCFGVWDNYAGIDANIKLTEIMQATPPEEDPGQQGPGFSLSELAGKILVIRGQNTTEDWVWATQLVHETSGNDAVIYYGTKSMLAGSEFSWQQQEGSWQISGNNLSLGRGDLSYDFTFEDGEINEGENVADVIGDGAYVAGFYDPLTVATTAVAGYKFTFLGAPTNSILEFVEDGSALIYEENDSANVIETVTWQLAENDTQILITKDNNEQYGYGNYTEFSSFMEVYGTGLDGGKFLVHVVGNPIVDDVFSDLVFTDSRLKQCIIRLAQYNNWQDVSDVTRIECSSLSITSAEGLEQFPGLKELNLSHNLLTSINLTPFTDLEILNLADNKLTTINLDVNRQLHTATLVNNPFDQATLDYLASIDWIANLLYGDTSAPVITSRLNDTGITSCSNEDTNGLSCPVSGFPGQDGQMGRDEHAAEENLEKSGGGRAGFDYTKLDANGNELGQDASTWSCVKDNVTGLVWEVKTTDEGKRDMNNTYTWYNSTGINDGGLAGTSNGGVCTDTDKCDTEKYVSSVNAEGLCGANDWRLPDKEELRSILDYGKPLPAIDTNYFPNTKPEIYWSVSPVASNPGLAWNAYFNYGDVYYGFKTGASFVRLVRGGSSNE